MVHNYCGEMATGKDYGLTRHQLYVKFCNQLWDAGNEREFTSFQCFYNTEPIHAKKYQMC